MHTPLIWTPHYYRQFFLSLEKAGPHIFSKFNLLYGHLINTDTFYGPYSVLINKV